MTWNNVLLSGLAASLALVGCTVTASSDGTLDGGSTGGAASAAGGAGTAGAGGTAGASSSGGAAGASTGSGGAAPDSGCNVCLKSKCASEFDDCTNDPEHACGKISATNRGEFARVQLCMFAVTGDSSTPVFTSQDLETCVGDSAESGGVPSAATLALITCARGAEDASTQPCTEECYGASVPY